jgi:hypothetical protein
VSDRSMNSATPKQHRRLAPSEKYEIFVSVLTGQATQRETAAKWKTDRSTVSHICRVAKQGALDALSASVPEGQAELASPDRNILISAPIRAIVVKRAYGSGPVTTGAAGLG